MTKHYWTKQEESFLGKVTDSEAAQKLNIPYNTVKNRRIYLKIPAYKKAADIIDWSDKDISLIGKVSDKKAAEIFGVSPTAVMHKRRALGKVPKRGARGPKAKFKWDDVKGIDQPEFWEKLALVWHERHGEKLTYKQLANLTYWSHSRIQKWFTAGTAQEPLSLPARHHMYLTVRYLKPSDHK